MSPFFYLTLLAVFSKNIVTLSGLATKNLILINFTFNNTIKVVNFMVYYSFSEYVFIFESLED